jgi:hypothetical protein
MLSMIPDAGTRKAALADELAQLQRTWPQGNGITPSTKLVGEAGRGEWASACGIFQPKPFGREFTDATKRTAERGEGLLGQQRLTVAGRNGEEQLEVLAVAERVFERRPAVVHPLGVGADGNRLGAQDGAAAALFAQVIQVGGQPVAHIDHRFEPDEFVQGQRFANPWREIEVMAQNAAAQRAGNE